MQGGCTNGSTLSRTVQAVVVGSRARSTPSGRPRSLNLTPTTISYHIMASPPPFAALLYTRFLTYRQAAQHSQGIQTLLEAEKDAAKVVQEARQCA